MQKPIRYYITKSGDEPMVRSVKVALAARDDADRESAPYVAPESSVAPRESQNASRGVRRLVKSAMQKHAAHR